MDLLLVALATILLGWLALSVPFFPGAGFFGVGESVSPKSGDKVMLWVPPLVQDGMLLRIDVRNTDSIVYNGGGVRRTLWKHGDALLASVPCSDFSGHGILDVHSKTSAASVDLRLIGQLSLGKGILYSLVFFCVTWLLTRFFPSGGIATLFRCALALRFFYGFAVPWYVASPDVRDHFIYIKMILDTMSLPAPGACLQCYQPPPYYVFATIWARIGMALGLDATDFLRLLSLLMSAGFLFFGLKIIDDLMGRTREGFLAMILFAFWPAVLLAAPVINNDVPVNLFGAASIFALLRWKNGRKSWILLVALVCAGVATLFKSNGVLYMVLIGLGVVVWGGKTLCRREVLQALGVFVLVGAVGLGTNLLRSQRSEGSDPLVGNIVNHSKIYANLRDESDLETFLPLPGQLATAFEKMPNDDSPDPFTHSFWAASLRSNVDGMHRMDDRIPNGLLLFQIKMALLLLLALFAFHGACLGWRENLFLVGGVLLFLGASMAFRWRYPFACSANIRYVLGLIIPFSVLVEISTGSWKGRWRVVPWFLAGGFSALSIWVYLAFGLYSL